MNSARPSVFYAAGLIVFDASVRLKYRDGTIDRKERSPGNSRRYRERSANNQTKKKSGKTKGEKILSADLFFNGGTG